MKKLFIWVVLFLIIRPIYSQKKSEPFQGKIVYKVTLAEDIDPVYKAQMPSQVIMLYGDKKQKMTMTAGASTQQIIIDTQNKMTFLLFNVMGQKFYVKSPVESPDSAKVRVVDIKYYDETKEIAGYKCYKAGVISESSAGRDTSIVYYTEELGEVNSEIAEKSVKGVKLQFDREIPSGGTITLTATIIEKKKIPKKEFNIPADYVEKTMEELKKMGGG